MPITPQKTAKRLLELRTGLALNQVQFASLFGAHPMTVSKWERGLLQPTDYQWALILEFEKALQRKKAEDLGRILLTMGVAAALYQLLKGSRE